jgi:hypothetical protein
MTNVIENSTPIKSLDHTTFKDGDQPLSLEDWQIHFRRQIERARCAVLTDADRVKLVEDIRTNVTHVFYSPEEYPGVFEGWITRLTPATEEEVEHFSGCDDLGDGWEIEQ